MYVDRSLSGDQKKAKLIYELKSNNCIRFKRNTTSKFLVGITVKWRNFIIHEEYFYAKNIFWHPFIQNPKHTPNVVQDLSTPMKKAF